MSTDNLILTAEDMNAFHSLLRAQGNIGKAQTAIGQAQFLDFFSMIDNIAYDHCRLATYPKLQSWMLNLVDAATNTQTSYKMSAAGMYVLYMYYQFNVICMASAPEHMEPCAECGQHGFPAHAEQRGGQYVELGDAGLPNATPWNWFCAPAVSIWQAPATIKTFYDAIGVSARFINTQLLSRQGSTDAVAIMYPGPNHSFEDVQQFMQSRFNPANWTDSGNFLTAIYAKALWQEQSQLVTTMIGQRSLSGPEYLLFFYLLIALSTADSTQQQKASTILNTPTSSPEYANDIFINQLVFANLMLWADPLGSFGYNNTQLQALLDQIAQSIVVSSEPAKAIQQSISTHLKILNSDSAYPMQDPYNPSIGFNTRKADTLAALDTALQSMT